MIINERCNCCKEPSKYPAGWYDKEDGKWGHIYNCENKNCSVKQMMMAVDEKALQDRIKVQNINAQNGMYAGYIAVLRKDTRTSMLRMSQVAGCSPAEYSSYEHERKPFDKHAYEKCEKYLKDLGERNRRSEETVREKLLKLGTFRGEKKEWKELEQWVDTVNKIISGLEKENKQ